MLTVEDNIAVIGGVMTDEEIGQDITEVVEEELQEEDEESTDENLMKPTTEEIRKTIDTLETFLMFTKSDKIRVIPKKASTLFIKELWELM